MADYYDTPEFSRRWDADLRKDLTVIEMSTDGYDDADFAEIYLKWLNERLGEDCAALWLAGLRPPLEERSDNEIRRVLFSKLQEAMR